MKRLSSGLSDQQIADELYLSLNTIKWHNRQIYSKLGVSSRTQAIALTQKSPLFDTDTTVSVAPLVNPRLPAPTTTFIGRSREIEQVKQLLRSARLLTLTGPGGIGKTRLLLRVAAEVADGFIDGVFFVDLAPLAEHNLVAKTIATAIGVMENSDELLIDTLKRVLAQQEVLLLIDNFEHVIQASPVVSELLVASPRLKILVTSRESLRLSGEQEFPVVPLSLPRDDGTSTQNVAESEAGALFIQRAQMTLPHFQVTDENMQAIAEICHRLDGLPLAIELAAARCKLLTPQALLSRLDGTQNESPLHALSHGARDVPPRHRTMRDSIEWSYQLLNEDEKILFARLAVFRGSRSLEAIQAVCSKGLSIDVFDGLASLIDKSLIQQKDEPSGELRFTLLETIQQYAYEQLEARGEVEKMRRRHAAYFVSLAERAEPELRIAKYDYWSQQFDLDLDNIRAVLKWSLTGGNLVDGVRLVSAFGQIWYGQGNHVEGSQWTHQFLTRLDEVPLAYHPQFLIHAGYMTFLHDLGAASQLFETALDISRRLGDKLQIAWALTLLGYTKFHNPEVALPLANEGLSLFRHLKYLPGIAQALNVIGEIARCNGDDVHAKLVYDECLTISMQTGERRRIGYMWQNLAMIAQHERDHKLALDLSHKALQLALDMNNRFEIATALETLVGSIDAVDQPLRAARLLGAVESVHDRLGAFHQPTNQFETDRIVAQIKAQLDAAAFQTAWAEGKALSLEQAIAEVLSVGNM